MDGIGSRSNACPTFKGALHVLHPMACDQFERLPIYVTIPDPTEAPDRQALVMPLRR